MTHTFTNNALANANRILHDASVTHPRFLVILLSPPTSTERLRRPLLVCFAEAQAGQQPCRPRRPALRLHVRQPGVHVRETCGGLFPSILEPLVVALLVELGEARVEVGLFAEERVAPDIGFENGFERGRVVADDLGRVGLLHDAKEVQEGEKGMKEESAYLLFDEEDGDVCGNGDLAEGDVAQEGGFTDTVATDEAVPATVC